MVPHETNTFSPISTDRGQFEARDLRYGGEILEAYRDTGTCLGGMIDGAAARGVTLVPSLAAAASPAGRVLKSFYAGTRERLLADLRAAGPLDGVLLDLHGAMVETATLLHGYKTYPHVDMDARGREAALRLADVAGGRLRPTVAFRQPPMLPPIAGQATARGPMRRLYDLADAMERRPGVISI